MGGNMNVYLIPADDATYVSCVSDIPPSADAIFLVKEGVYPVEAWHERHDLNLDRLLMREEIGSRDELIRYLNFIGTCRHALLNLWDYDIDIDVSDELLSLFDVCYQRKIQLIGEEMMEMCDGVDESYCGDYNAADGPDENLPF